MKTRKRLTTVVAALAAVAVIGVAGGAAYLKLSAPPFVAGSAATELQPGEGNQLEGRRVFFGHQSVGKNVLDGVRALPENDRARLSVVGVDDSGALQPLEAGYIADARLGKNGDPQSKFRAFSEYLRSGVGDEVDVALMKLCYLDFSATTNPRALFNDYRSTMQALESEYPDVSFIYATVPLTESAGYKNVLRTEFNSLVRSELADRNIFDIAYLESSSEASSGSVDSFYGFPSESLRPEFSSDGAHLNGVGSERAARGFVAALAKASNGAK